jgi:hypothetical protein
MGSLLVTTKSMDSRAMRALPTCSCALATGALLLATASPVLGAETGASWNDHNPGANADIVVCWSRSTEYSRTIEGAPLPKDPGTLAVRRWVREAFENTWARYTNVMLYQYWSDGAWNFCTSEDEERTIVLEFSKTNRADFGRKEDRATRVVFDSRMTNRRDIELAAINLFGQALEVLPVSTPSDHVPTPQEIAKSQSIYGTKYAGALVSYGGHCLSNEYFSTTEPQLTRSYQCYDRHYDLRWFPYIGSPTAPTGLATLNNSYLNCLQPLGAAGSRVMSWDCTATEPAGFQFTQFKWKTAGELCVAAEEPLSGATLRLADCNGSGNARWDLDFANPARVRLSGTELCAGVDIDSIQAETNVTLVPCADIDGAKAASLNLSSSKMIHVDEPVGNCVSVDPALTVGSPLTIASCSTNGDLAQTFHVSGILQNNGYCLGVNIYAEYSETNRPESSSCDVSSAELSTLLPSPLEWDYYW